MPGISLSISIGRTYHEPDNYWVCAPQAYINRPNINNYYVPPSRSITIIHNTTIINNTTVYNNQTYIAGPRQQELRQVTHQNIRVYNISNASAPSNTVVRNNTVNIYRPEVRVVPHAQPQRVVNAVAYKQQHPQQAIAAHGPGGAAGFNHHNAAQLAVVAKSSAPDNKVVKVNPIANRPNNAPPGQPANNPPAQIQGQQQAQQKAAQQQTQQRQQQQAGQQA